MNEKRFNAIEQSLSAIARKVFSCVPIEDSWNTNKILSEMKRLTGNTMDKRVLDGCLMTLVENGLVKESPRGVYRRVTPKREPIKNDPIIAEAAMKPTPPVTTTNNTKNDVDPLSSIGETCEWLREIARRTYAAADKIEKLALDMQQQIENSSSENTKLTQLKQLLKEIGA